MSQENITTDHKHGGFWGFLKAPFRKKNNDANLREAIEDYLEDTSISEEDDEDDASISAHEKTLISNVLKIHERTVADVMVPRADIFGISDETSKEELLKLLSKRQFSRIPVYKNNLDEALGCIHIKDVLSKQAKGEDFQVKDLIRETPIVAPSMRLLDLLWEMRKSRRHMCLVVDEFGGIDGLITLGDLVESVIGDINDEHDEDIQAEMIQKGDGVYIADARYDIEDFEEEFGSILTEEERDDCDTLGGLAFHMAGRVPARGEVLSHESGMVIEVMDADPRRVHKLRVKNLPEPRTAREDE